MTNETNDDDHISQPSKSPNQTHLTPNQVEILQEFRTELEREGHLKPDETLGTDDETLIRFLRARKFNLQASKRMITQCLQWRHQFEGIGIDGLYDQLDPFNFPNRAEVFKYWPMYFHRIDKLGRPVNIQMFGSLDLNKLYSVIDKETHFRTVVANCEALTREVLPACTYRLRSKSTNPRSDPPAESNSNSSCQANADSKITNAFCILDLKGFSLSQFWQIKSIARVCFAISQDYYPETMGYLAIINAPKSFTTIFKAVTPWLSKETISKINILGDDYQATLLEYIDDENLPSFLGGKCECDQDQPWACSKNDENFERSPWLKNRDWKNHSWRAYGHLSHTDSNLSSSSEKPLAPNLQNGVSDQTHRDSQHSDGHHSQSHDQTEVSEDGVTSDGALIIKTSPKTQANSSPTE